MLRSEIRWSGGPAGSGLTVLNLFGDTTTDPAPVLTALSAFAEDVAAVLPSSVSLQVANSIDVVNTQSGQLEGTLSGTAQPVHTGAVVSYTIAAGVGARIRWWTNDYTNGRRKIGTSFIVPLPVGYTETNGTLTSGLITALLNAGNTLVSALTTAGADLGVWQRNTVPAPGAGNGNLSSVESVTVPDQVSWLTSRRS